MRTARCLLPLILVAFFAARAQDKPNFSGSWKEVGITSRVHTLRIDHKDPDLLEYEENREVPGSGSTLQRPIAMLSGRRNWRTDGPERHEKNDKGREWWSTVLWQGPELVFLTTVKDGYRVAVTREAWSLSDDGATLTKTRRVVNMDGVTEVKISFQKQ
jgi:hypothetical protein